MSTQGRFGLLSRPTSLLFWCGHVWLVRRCYFLCLPESRADCHSEVAAAAAFVVVDDYVVVVVDDVTQFGDLECCSQRTVGADQVIVRYKIYTPPPSLPRAKVS